MPIRLLTAIVLGVLPALPLAAAEPLADFDALIEMEVHGGLVVLVGPSDAARTAKLRTGDNCLAQGLDVDDHRVASARRALRNRDDYGAVSVDSFDGRNLPYVDRLVNVLVVDAPFDLTGDEMRRVLVPGGTLLVRQDDGSYRKTVKPWLETLDDWSHNQHDASGNPVSRDLEVGSPRRLKWKAGPLWSRSHEFVSSVAAMVSSGGRLFCVIDEGITSLTDPPVPERWTLIARDAQNGVLLWKRPLPAWRGTGWGNTALRARPASVPRRVVASADRLYLTESYESPVEILDAATGKTLSTLDGTGQADEILHSSGTLLVHVVGSNARRQAASGYIVALDPTQERQRWRAAASKYVAASMVAAGDRLVYSTGAELVCLAIAGGDELWRQPIGKGTRSMILYRDQLIEGTATQLTVRSAESGKVIWKRTASAGDMKGTAASMKTTDLFVARGCLWHTAAGGILGRDLATGEVVSQIDPSSVQSAGHHLRCYPAKATERFLITQFRGAEFVSLTDEQHYNNDWIRGACSYGVMPAGGLLYVPPNPCFCYPGMKLNGLLAFDGTPIPDDFPAEGRIPRLQQGPAYGLSLAENDAAPWPTYRHDARRSGSADTSVATDPGLKWNVALEAPLTPPVSARGRVLVAEKDRHTLHALDAARGQPLWQYTAGGRIDSPPTVYRNLVLLGSADGYLYCLGADDGRLVWRFRAAPIDRRIVVFNQLESPWQVHGSVLVHEGLVYCTAGRSSSLDGGIWVYAIRPDSGEVVHVRRLDTWSPTREDAVDQPFIPSYQMEGTRSDLLVAQGGWIYLGQYKLSASLEVQETPYAMPDPENPVVAMDISEEDYTASDPFMDAGYQEIRTFHHYMEKAHPELSEYYKKTYGGMNMGDRVMGEHLVATGGFLDDTWFNRTYWMVSSNWPGWYHAHRGARTGQILVVGPEKTFALQAFPTRNKQSPLFTPGKDGYLLLADHNTTQPVLDLETRGATKGLGYTRMAPPAWHDWVPIRVRAMVLAKDRLFVAGPPDVVPASDPMAALDGRDGAILRVYRAGDGIQTGQRRLSSPPVFDGLIAADGRLLMSTTDGHVICLGD